MRAHHTALKRDDALKVLPEAFAADSERLARFQREAQILASLNHPHIAHVYGLEHADNVTALVMELVEGPTLAERIAQGPIPVNEALHIARQIADAIDTAHEKAIIHRDLKPANVKVRPDGTVKVLDFGLAKAMEPISTLSPRVSQSPTMTPAMTQTGIILGTAAYMSPEQAKGIPADKRSDIWSFGCVLYEMLSGRCLFARETVAETLAALLTVEPDFSPVPASVRPLLQRCLERDPRRRLRDIGDVQILLDTFDHLEQRTSTSQMRRNARFWWATLVVGVGIVALSAWFGLGDRQPIGVDGPMRQLALSAPGLQLARDATPAISPDARKQLYVADDVLWVQELDQLDRRQIVDTRVAERGQALTASRVQYPFWAPDSQAVGYFLDSKLWTAPISGEQPRAIASARLALANGPGAVWTADGRIVFAPANSSGGLLAVSAQGGEFTEILGLDQKIEGDLHTPSLLPDGQGLLFVVDRVDGGPDSLGVFMGKTYKTILRVPGEELESPVSPGLVTFFIIAPGMLGSGPCLFRSRRSRSRGNLSSWQHAAAGPPCLPTERCCMREKRLDSCSSHCSTGRENCSAALGLPSHVVVRRASLLMVLASRQVRVTGPSYMTSAATRELV